MITLSKLIRLAARISIDPDDFVCIDECKGAQVYVPIDRETSHRYFSPRITAFVVGEDIYVRSLRTWDQAATRRHELAHVEQFRKGGALFIVHYAFYACTRGYVDNPYEQEARMAEVLKL